MRNFITIFFLFFSLQSTAQGFLKAKGTSIVNGEGKEIILRGWGLGGWMLQEPYMLQLSGVATAQFDIKNKITQLIGKEKTKEFYQSWINNHCTKADIDSMAAWGFNSVRLPFHYNLFTLPIEEETETGKQTWLPQGFQLVDTLLSWCKVNKIYLILDLHAAPGGQGNDLAIADVDKSKKSLWESDANKEKTIQLWQKLAARYANEEWIGGYDLINEPNWGFENKSDYNGCAEKKNTELVKLLKDITTAIRKVDKNHILYLEGNCWANNYEGFFPLWDNNLVISFHKYWNNTKTASIQKFLDYREKYNVPIWMGESGENSNNWMTNAVTLFEQHKIGWNLWPWKKSGINNPLQVPITTGFQKIIDYWKGNAQKPNEQDSYQYLMQYAEAANIKTNNIQYDVIDALTRQITSNEIKNFKPLLVQNNAIIFAADYDLGRGGFAYHDKDSATYWVEDNNRIEWNQGRNYRNEGVDIEKCLDSISNGYNVGWTKDGEWMLYSLYAPKKGVFNVTIRTASKQKNGSAKILLNNKSSRAFKIPNSKGHQNWTNIELGQFEIKEGWNSWKLLIVKGGFNINFFQFEDAEQH